MEKNSSFFKTQLKNKFFLLKLDDKLNKKFAINETIFRY